MTDYEKLSLMLLAQIGSGISYQLTALNPSAGESAIELHGQILEWQKQLKSTIELLQKKITDQSAE